jgi:hypothetical protein
MAERIWHVGAAVVMTRCSTSCLPQAVLIDTQLPGPKVPMNARYMPGRATQVVFTASLATVGHRGLRSTTTGCTESAGPSAVSESTINS